MEKNSKDLLVSWVVKPVGDKWVWECFDWDWNILKMGVSESRETAIACARDSREKLIGN